MSWELHVTARSGCSAIVGGARAREVLVERVSRIREAGLRTFVVSDENVAACWPHELEALGGDGAGPGDRLVITPGEVSKTTTALTSCWDWLSGVGARRDDVVVAFGGGVVGDLAGFAAATYLRGVRLWQVPTTLLAQVDSSIGGKVAVNLPAGKNLVGTFYQPELVVVDPGFLETLPDEEFASGLGEVLKYGLLVGEDLFGRLEREVEPIRARRTETLGGIVARCIDYKASVVEEDETDQGRRAVLNLGHSFGHAFERALGYGTITHGAAVGLGLLGALAVSEIVVGLPTVVRERVQAMLTSFGLATTPPSVTFEEVLAAMLKDKKVTAGGLGFVCLDAPGRPRWGVAVDEAVLRRAFEKAFA